jgi:branched-chain amino acid transport system permease protein
MSYLWHLLIYLGVYTIVSISLNLIVGYCGLLSLAHAGFFALGGYVYALVTLTFKWGFVEATFLAVLISIIFSLMVSIPAWQFKGNFFVLVSLAVQALLFGAFYNWYADAPIGTWKNLTNGVFGLSGVPKPIVFGWQLQQADRIVWLTWFLTLLCVGMSWLLLGSPWGRLLRSLRDDELVTRGLGKNTRWVKTQAFAIACGMVALAGAILTSYIGFIDPSAAALDESILMLSMVLVGGVGNFRGPLVGALVLLAIPEALRFVQIPDAIAANVRLILYGVSLLLVIHLRPEGIAGKYRLE